MADEDAIATSKALERSARLAYILGQQHKEESSTTANKSCDETDQVKTEGENTDLTSTVSPLRVGAFFVKNPARNRNKKEANNIIPFALSDLVRKVSSRQPQQQPVSVAGDTTTVKDSNSSPQKLSWRRPSSSDVPIPGSVTQVRRQLPPCLLAQQERELLAKSISGGSNNKSITENDEKAALAEKATTMGIMIHHMMGTTYTNNSGTDDAATHQLQQQETNALLKQRLPREMMMTCDENDESHVTVTTSTTTSTTIPYATSQRDFPDYFHHDTSIMEHDEPMDHFSSSATITAEIVDDAKEREKIAKEAQDALISNAVIATSIDQSDGGDSFRKQKQARWNCIAVVLCLLLVMTAIVLGGVCGTGRCSSPSTDNGGGVRIGHSTRAKAVTDFIASITLSDEEAKMPLTYPFVGTDRSPEQEALEHLIDGDSLQLSVIAAPQGDVTVNWRLIQRYALLVIWFTNGPWIEPNTSGGINAAPLASAAWLVGSDECGWAGVKCDSTGRVVQLHLEARMLTGTVPKDMGLLTDLFELRLDDNNLTGSLQDTIAILVDMGALTVLRFGRNHFIGTIPELLKKRFHSLKALSLNDNAITGTIPEFIATMTTLELLNLSDNMGLTGTIPASLAALTSLTSLGLGSGGFSRFTPIDFFDGMRDLVHLDFGGIDDNNDGDQRHSIFQLAGLTQLTHLVYTATLLEGTIPSEIVDWWPKMNTISLTKCNITGTIPDSLSQWSQLTSINLSLNQLTGSIPVSFYTAWSDTLTAFSVPFNQLVGSFPSELGLWSKLGSLDVRTNAMTGSLPTSIGLLSDLTQILVSGNQFTGTIPNEVLMTRAYAEYESNNFIGTAPYCVNNNNQSKLIAVKVDCWEVRCPCCAICN